MFMTPEGKNGGIQRVEGGLIVAGINPQFSDSLQYKIKSKRKWPWICG